MRWVNGSASMTLIETPDDDALRIDRANGRLNAAPVWHTQKGRFAYDRKLRYIFFDKGSHVAICKRYRRHDEIGTPWCITYDFDTEEDNAVTIRDRDSLEQSRVALDEVVGVIQGKLRG